MGFSLTERSVPAWNMYDIGLEVPTLTTGVDDSVSVSVSSAAAGRKSQAKTVLFAEEVLVSPEGIEPSLQALRPLPS